MASSLDRRHFGKLLAAGTAGLTLSDLNAFAAPPQERPPNIVFIMADDLGYNHLGCYGQEKIRTPNIDRLASEGMRFTQSYAGCTVCAPSRSSLMTGQHTGRTPVRGNTGGIPLRDEHVTVAEVLQQADYATGCFGKWGLGEAGTSGVPSDQGFDEFFGYLHQIHAHFYYPEYLWKNGDKFPLPDNVVRGGNAQSARLPGDAGGKRTQYAPDVINEHARTFIRANQDRPFFCYIPTIIPHVELAVPDASLALYEGAFEEEPFVDPRPGYAGSETPRAMLAAMITHMDRNVGRVLDLLGELDIAENTLVIFTSDNGPQSGYGGTGDHFFSFFNPNGPLRGYKNDMYEGGLRVPTIARWPGKIQPGTTSDHAWYFPDVMPTLAELAGTAVPERWPTDGLSIVPTLRDDGQQPEHEYMYWEDLDEAGPRQAARSGPWKAVRSTPDADLELYNLADDLDESNNVATQHPEIRSEIRAYMEKAHVKPPPQVEPERVLGRRYR